MKRVVKFKAKDYKGNWQIGTYYFGVMYPTSFAGHYVNDTLIDEKTLCQFIDRTDKNGKEIYEGDITNYGEVFWCNDLSWDSGGSSHSGFYFKRKWESELGDLDYHLGFDDKIEVIGNIYDLPENEV